MRLFRTCCRRSALMLLIALMATGCCQRNIYEGVIAVREGDWRIQKPLPLSETAADSIFTFIEWDGSVKDPGAVSELAPDPAYRQLLDVLSVASNCFQDSLVSKAVVSGHVESIVPRKDIYDAREQQGPDQGGGRHAYLFNDEFWFIFYIEDTLAGRVAKKYSTLIVQKQFEEIGEK